MGQHHELTTCEVETPLNAAINASIFVSFTGIPKVLPTDNESKIKFLKSHHHKVRENIITAFILEKERLLSKCKDNLAKHKRLIEDSKNIEFRLAVAAKENARQKREEQELEKAKWLRGPKWLLLLQMEDAKNGVWDAPEEETEEEERRRVARFKVEMERREKKLLKEMEGRTIEEYQCKPNESYDFNVRFSSPKLEGGRYNGDDVVMGGLDSVDVSTTKLWTPAEITTSYEIQDKFDIDVQKLLEEGVKKLKVYDRHAGKVLAEYKQDLAKGSVSNIETTDAGGSLKRKSASMTSPLDPPHGSLKRPASIQSPSENGGSTLKKFASIQTPAGTGSHTLKKSVSIQIPTDNKSIFSNTSPIVRSPLELTGNSLKKVRLDDPFWSPASPSPLSTGPPNFPREFSFPINVPTGPANSSPARRPFHPSRLTQSPSTPRLPTGPASSDTFTPCPSHPLDLPHRASLPVALTTSAGPKDTAPHIGKSFISSITWTSNQYSRLNLVILSGDEVRITNHVMGNEYDGYNITSQKTGLLDIRYFLQDIEPIGLVGRTFISSSNYVPRSGSNFYNLEIRPGDKVKVTGHHSGDAFIGINLVSRKTGNFNTKFYLRDIEAVDNINKACIPSGSAENSDNFHKDTSLLIGKTFIATSTWGPRTSLDTANMSIEIGDKIEIMNYIGGITYVGFNKRSKQVGQLSKECIWRDMEHTSPHSIDKTFEGTSTRRFENFLDAPTLQTEVGPKNDHEDHTTKDPAVYIGTIFVSSHTWLPNRRDAADYLDIKPGDAIEIISHNSEDMYEGYNARTRKTGKLVISYFLKDIKPFHNSNVGKIFTATSRQHSSDITALRIEIGDKIEIARFIDHDTYIGHNLTTEQRAGRIYIDKFKNDIKDRNYIGKAFTATSTQDLKSSSDGVTLVIAVGDRIKILKPVTKDGYYLCLNMRTNKEGHVRLDDFQKDIEAASRPSDKTGSSQEDLNLISRTSTPSNGSSDTKSGKSRFSIKGASLLARPAVESAHIQDTLSGPSKGHVYTNLSQAENERRIKMYTQHFGRPPKCSTDYYQPNNPTFNPHWLRNTPSNAQADIRRMPNGMPIVSEGGKNRKGAGSIEKLARRGL